ncbi:hypothetical protein F2Q69_00011292 [Brassica cretica]|uniref:Uncharacterized protein n=1 Tax=Brassica cretica TaxID=69181 RepID=A0A8S9QJV7_BRACR|nr:hypothetical protein F2Q69_00011292 [Brassica cretica]
MVDGLKRRLSHGSVTVVFRLIKSRAIDVIPRVDMRGSDLSSWRLTWKPEERANNSL